MIISTISWWALTCWFKPCRTSPKGKRVMELNLYFRLLWFFCPHFSGNLRSVFIYLLTYREKERCSCLMVSAHLCLSKGEMAHGMGSHSGQAACGGGVSGSLSNPALIRVQWSGREGHVFQTQEFRTANPAPSMATVYLSSLFQHLTKQKHLLGILSTSVSMWMRRKHGISYFLYLWYSSM